MDVLVLGGSVFVGRAVVDTVLARGDAVTVFNRGVSGTLPDGVTHVTGDRTSASDLEQLRGRPFDLVVDTAGYTPSHVRDVAELLEPTTGFYAFVSSINVYPGWPESADYVAEGVHDGDPDATAAPDGLKDAEPYGWLKVGCERAVVRAFGAERSAVLRAGAIVGPGDAATGRLPWWIDRVARGGEILVPGTPDDPIALIDVRDLAQFALSGLPGTYTVAGPHGRDTRRDLMDACLAATGSDAQLTWVDSEWLAGEDVVPWMELPLWVPPSAGPSLFEHDSSAAEAAGLSERPLADTVADTWAWLRSAAVPDTIGLAGEKEQALLAKWHASHG